MIKHGIYFLTEARRDQYKKAIYVMTTGVTKISEIPSVLPNNLPYLYELPKTPLDYVSLPFFTYWLVGFTISEGSFFIKSNNDASFQLKQRVHITLFEAFKLLFNTTRKINIENDIYAQFAVSSKKDIQTVINLFSNGIAGNMLMGVKLDQYNRWFNNLKNSKRYSDLNYPNVITSYKTK